MEGGRHAERDESERGRSCHRQATLVSATGLPTGARPARASLTDAACAPPHGQPWAAVCRRAQGRGREQAGSRAPRHWHRRMTPPPGALPGPPSRRTRPPARWGVAAAVSDLRPADAGPGGRGRTRRTARANSSSARTRAHVHHISILGHTHVKCTCLRTCACAHARIIRLPMRQFCGHLTESRQISGSSDLRDIRRQHSEFGEASWVKWICDVSLVK